MFQDCQKMFSIFRNFSENFQEIFVTKGKFEITRSFDLPHVRDRNPCSGTVCTPAPPLATPLLYLLTFTPIFVPMQFFFTDKVYLIVSHSSLQRIKRVSMVSRVKQYYLCYINHFFTIIIKSYYLCVLLCLNEFLICYLVEPFIGIPLPSII